ncbi:MAG: hypothetical protein FJW31_02555 [Acidobacteria bacterium]|nr:hypothetical protein [Acidobacteriota bacterium]
MPKKTGKSKPEPPVGVSVFLKESHLGATQAAGVQRELKAKGFTLRENLEAIGVLTGSAPAAALEALESVPGAEKVEKERTDYRTQQ